MDGLAFDEAGTLLVFPGAESLHRYAADQGIEVAVEPSWYDFDSLDAWLERPKPELVDCSEFLNAWNLFADLRSSIARRSTARDPDGGSQVYDKLFWGCNLPSVTPQGERYEPQRTAADIETLVRMLGEGLRLFRAHVGK